MESKQRAKKTSWISRVAHLFNHSWKCQQNCEKGTLKKFDKYPTTMCEKLSSWQIVAKAIGSLTYTLQLRLLTRWRKSQLEHNSELAENINNENYKN